MTCSFRSIKRRTKKKINVYQRLHHARVCFNQTGIRPSILKEREYRDYSPTSYFESYDELGWVEDPGGNKIYWLFVVDKYAFTKFPYVPYLSIFNYEQTKEMRVHFMDNGIDHGLDETRELVLEKEALIYIEEYLRQHDNLWKMLKEAWNDAAFPWDHSSYDEMDVKHAGDPRYVPSTQPIPNWEIHFTDERNDLSAKNEKSTTA